MNEIKNSHIEINYKWCKACGICYTLCPKGVLGKDQFDKVIVSKPEACIGCRVCEEHCPDYCIKIGGKFLDKA